MNKEQEIKELVDGNIPMNGYMADDIITTLIDNCNDEFAAKEFGISEELWHKLVDKMERDIRYRVRELR